MAITPLVVVHLKDVENEEPVRESIEKRCVRLAEEFPEVDHFELKVDADGVGFLVHGHATGKNTDIATHATATEPGPAAEQVLDKIAKQLRKGHDKRIFSQRRAAQKHPPKRDLES
jgi:ribosome-associated translation inhibitor RaiA